MVERTASVLSISLAIFTTMTTVPAPHPALVEIARGNDLPANLNVTLDLVDSAIEHGMAPILDDLVTSHGIEGDQDALMRLAAWSMESVAHTKAATDALSTLIDRCAELDIEPAIFKGQAVGLRWYDRPELRPSYDIDMFVRPDQRDRLVDLVQAFGSDPTTEAAIAVMIDDGRVFEETITISGVAVDIHSDPENHVLHPRNDQLMWEHIEPLELPNGQTILALDLETSLIIALTHLFRDNFADLLHVYDVGRMMDAGPDWQVVADIAESEAWTDLIRFSVGFVCNALDRPSPLPRNVSLTSAALIRTIWPPSIHLQGNQSVVRSHRRHLYTGFLLTDRRSEVLVGLLRRVFPPRALIDVRLECNCPYPIALLRWRLAQHAYLKRFRTRALDYRSDLSGTSDSHG